MNASFFEHHPNDLNPKQPEFVLVTSDYEKRVLMDSNFAHFYQFKAESDHMSVIPDACIDIMFWCKDGKIKSKIAGSRLYKEDTETDLNCEYFGVRFLPGINPVSDIMKFSELTNNEFNFEEMITSYSDREKLFEKMYFSNTFADKMKVFMDYYSAHVHSHTDETNHLKLYLKDKIVHSDGTLKLDELSELTGYSQRYLNKKIHEDFGMSPKSLLRIVRFQNAITCLTQTITDVKCIETAVSSGYYDQSHFNKDFKDFTGQSPTVYINNLINNSYDKKLHII